MQNKQAESYAKELEKVLTELKTAIVGQDYILERIIIALLADGHALIEGVPGLAKTLIIKTLSNVLDAPFVRFQFTPDMLPADIIGTKVFNQKTGSFRTEKGPIFSNLILADEVNRAPPKVQSALLEAMQERQVTIQGETHNIKAPFLVMATQNPIETEGTYKLPEAQVDRFMFKILIDFPTKEEEVDIVRRYTQGHDPQVKKILSLKKVLELQKFTNKVYADEKIEDYVTSIVDATRNPKKYGLDGHLEYGASPRASIWLIKAGKAHALLNGRAYVLPEDIKAIAHDVLRHRIILTYEAEAEDVKSDLIVDHILAKVKVP